MLVIKGIDKIKDYAFNKVWVVDNILTEKNYYHFIIERFNGKGKIDYVTKLSIKRKEEDYLSVSGDKCYRIYSEGKPTAQFVSVAYITEIQNLIDTFSEQLEIIPK